MLGIVSMLEVEVIVSMDVLHDSEQMHNVNEENQLLQEEHDRLQQRYSKLTLDAEQNERIWRER